ncbi:MAG: serine/threonine protein kinase [Bacteroides sp.]|nr:serine/threonine protein kinase [Bacteroides sp.]
MLSPNTQLQNHKYRIIKALGHGGFGITYLAEDIRLGRKIAIKELFIKNLCWRDNNQNVIYSDENHELFSQLHNRFLKEAKHLASISHPHIIHVHDSFEENRTAYYVMDYLEGENLFDLVKQKGPLTEKEALEVIRQAAEALNYMHGIQMTHFDVKPSNLMFNPTNKNVTLIDFGFSKHYDMNQNATTMLPAISNGFSATEMYTQSGTNTFSPQTDVYSLGATLYFLLTGITPPSALDRVTGELFVNMDNCPSSFQDVINKSMITSKTARLQTVSDFLNLLPNTSKTSHTNGISNNAHAGNDKERTELLTVNINNNKSKRSDKEASHNHSTVNNSIKKEKSSPFKTIGIIIAVIGIIFSILYFGGYIIFWDEVAPIQLEVFE